MSFFKPDHVIHQEERADPTYKGKRYVGRINLNSWSGLSRYRWLCISINGASNNRGKTWDVTYRFKFKYLGWSIIKYKTENFENILEGKI